MKKTHNKHYKFINSKTGNAIFYCSLSEDLAEDKVKEELDKIHAQVAVQNGIYKETVYWEEVKDGK